MQTLLQTYIHVLRAEQQTFSLAEAEAVGRLLPVSGGKGTFQFYGVWGAFVPVIGPLDPEHVEVLAPAVVRRLQTSHQEP